MATHQKSIMSDYFLLTALKVWGPLRKPTSSIFQAFNWYKNSFGEIHISQGLDWGSPLSHNSLLSEFTRPRFSAFFRKKRFCFFVFFIGQVWSFKIVKYWPRSFLPFIDLSWFSVQEGWILVNILQPSWRHTLSITHNYWKKYKAQFLPWVFMTGCHNLLLWIWEV